MSEEEICGKLQLDLKPGRYRHTLRVTETAVLLARHYHISEEKARLAGLLHDCGKEAGATLTHAAIGAQLAQSEYQIQDPEILSAIACHTTGKPAMSILEKILFVADYIEPGRDRAPHLDYLRKEAYQNLDHTILCILSDTLLYLKEAGVTIDENSIDTYNYYHEKCKNQEGRSR